MTDLNIAKRYLEQHTKQRGSIYEQDEISLIIIDLIEQIKNNDSKKKVVLIVDDLDRIDPEHIFRLLNIFASHQDYRSEDNKFGLDKMIVVCDVSNIKQIFYSKYGQNVDFSGYIDKFYSKEVFEYDISELVSEQVRAVLRTISVPEADTGDYTKNVYSFKENSFLLYATSIILSGLIYNKVINIRKLIKLINKNYSFERFTREYIFVPSDSFDSNYDIVVILKFLIEIFGSQEELDATFKQASRYGHVALTKQKEIWNYNSIIRYIIGIVIAFVDLDNNKFNSTCKDNYEYVNIEKDQKISYKFIDTNIRNVRYTSFAGIPVEMEQILNIGKPDQRVTRIDLFYYLHLALNKLAAMKDYS